MAFKRQVKAKTKWWLYCPRPTAGGIALIRALGGKRIRGEGETFRPATYKRVINWGSTSTPPNIAIRTMGQQVGLHNQADDVARVVDKLAFFRLVANEDTAQFLPRFTDDPRTATEWKQEGFKVVCRAVLNGHSGQGITIVGRKGTLVEAPLYTRYIPKDEEYRVHCIEDGLGNIKVFYAQKKVKRKDFTGKHNRLVRCYDNGYTYQHTGVSPPEKVFEAATVIFRKTGLDFGAVDVIYCREQNRAYVLEINTAPGLEGTSVEAYAKAFIENF